MKLSLKDLKIISNWFDIISNIEDLGDADLKVYDKINQYVEEHDNDFQDYMYVEDNYAEEEDDRDNSYDDDNDEEEDY